MVILDAHKPMTDDQRQASLETQLIDLAQNVDQYKLDHDQWIDSLTKITINLQVIYDINKDFRHSYSGIYDLIVSLRSEEREVLLSNFQRIKHAVYKVSPSEHFKKCIKKLNDHLFLEAARLGNLENYSEMIESYNQNMEAYNESRYKVESEIDSAKAQVAKLKSELDKYNTQSVTVLSIFTGIVMAFFGGFSLFDTAFTNLDSTDNFKLMYVISFIGFVLFNTIFSLIYAASKIMNIDIKSSCKYGTCRKPDGSINCNHPQRTKETEDGIVCGIWGKLTHKFTFIFVVNVIIVLAMLVFGVLYINNSRFATYISTIR